jgi:hypothetical protein
MANTPVAGSWGRVKAVKVAPSLTTPTFTWTGTTANLVGIDSWNVQESRAGGVPSALDFEGQTDPEGVVYPTLVRGGVGELPKVDIEGWFNVNPTNGTGVLIPNNAAIVLDLIFFKATPAGYIGVPAVVESFRRGGKVDDKTFRFTMTVVCAAPLQTYLSLGS